MIIKAGIQMPAILCQHHCRSEADRRVAEKEEREEEEDEEEEKNER